MVQIINLHKLIMNIYFNSKKTSTHIEKGGRMKAKLKNFCFFLIAAVTFSSSVFAQDLNETLSKLTKDAASTYVAPVISGFGADLNSGWLTRVPKPVKYSFDFNLKIVAMGTFFKDENKTFSTDANFRFNRNEADILTQGINNPNLKNAVEDQILSQDFNVGIKGPTIVGSKDDHVIVNFKGETFHTAYGDYTVPSQFVTTDITGVLDNLPIMPLGAPQLTIGTVFGSSLSIRYLPSLQLNSDLGKFSYFGIGVMHNPAVWMQNPLPLDLAVGIFTQTMKVGDIFKATATQFGIFAGKTFGPSMLNVSPYAGISYETSSITIHYQQQYDTPTGPQTADISFDLSGDNSFRFTLGSTFKLAILSINIDYSIASYNTVSAGLGFDF